MPVGSWTSLGACAAPCKPPPLSSKLLKPTDAQLQSAAREQMDRLNRYSTYVGGWNYYDFNAQTQQVSLMPTSFGTAAGLVALFQRRRGAIAVGRDGPDGVVHSSTP